MAEISQIQENEGKEGQAAFPQQIFLSPQLWSWQHTVGIACISNTPSPWAELLWEFVLLSLGLVYPSGPPWRPQMCPERGTQ